VEIFKTRQNLPLETLLPIWHHAAKMSAGENQFSLARAVLKPAARQQAISYQSISLNA
jgi:hypothetical protein